MAKYKSATAVETPDMNQTSMPGVPAVTLGDRLRRRAQLPMQPRRAQKPLDIGFWDPMRDQLEMF